MIYDIGFCEICMRMCKSIHKYGAANISQEKSVNGKDVPIYLGKGFSIYLGKAKEISQMDMP